jgi:hypothetical protein
VHNALGIDDFYTLSNGNIIKINSLENDLNSDNSRKIKGFLSTCIKEVVDSVGVMCWRMSTDENHAMWKIFLNSGEGVAIKTTVSDINESMSSDTNKFHFGKVNYINRANTEIGLTHVLDSVFTKSVHYNHEQEFRVITYKPISIDEEFFGHDNLNKVGDGFKVNVDTKILINEIVVSPYSPSWFYELVKSICQKYSLSVPVTWSEISLRKS